MISNEVRASYKWELIGCITLDDSGKIKWPATSKDPGVYKLRIKQKDNSYIDYIGETVNLHRRFQHYKTPGKSQFTNIRILKKLKEQSAAEATIEVYLIKDATITISETDKKIDFHGKASRRLFENLAQVVEYDELVENLNL